MALNPTSSDSSFQSQQTSLEGELSTSNGKKSVNFLTHSKCSVFVFIVVGVAGAVLLGLGAFRILGSMGSIGFIGSLAGGGVLTAISGGGLLWIAISSCKKSSPKDPIASDVSVVPAFPLLTNDLPITPLETDQLGAVNPQVETVTTEVKSLKFQQIEFLKFENATKLTAGVYEFDGENGKRKAIVIGEVTPETTFGSSSNAQVVYFDNHEKTMPSSPPYGFVLYNGRYGILCLAAVYHDHIVQYGLDIKSNVETDFTGQKWIRTMFPLQIYNKSEYPHDVYQYAKANSYLPD